MIISCPHCEAQYRYDVERFAGAPRKKVKCPKCSTVFEATNPDFDEEGDATSIGKAEAADDGPKPAGAATGEELGPLDDLAPIPRDLRVSLAVIAGNQAGAVFQVTKPRVFIGRGSGMEIQLKDSEVSRRHAMIEVRGQEVILVDLGATNGTFMDGRRVQRAPIGNHGEFTVGSTTLMLIITESEV